MRRVHMETNSTSVLEPRTARAPDIKRPTFRLIARYICARTGQLLAGSRARPPHVTMETGSIVKTTIDALEGSRHVHRPRSEAGGRFVLPTVETRK